MIPDYSILEIVVWPHIGAVLGDRLRMSSAQESGIFIRSVASRGHLGGLASTTRFMINALELLQNDITLVETVGAGQGDVEVVQLADTTIVVEVPGLGDEVQADSSEECVSTFERKFPISILP